MSVDNASPRPATADAGTDSSTGRNLGLALLVIATAQFMNTLDNTIVNIALPHIRSGLGFSAANLAWVVTAYALPFGGLLLVGGRAGDILGRRMVFRAGLLLFAVASLLSGIAQNQQTLIAGRALQGIAAAIVAPTALSLLATTFPAGAARNKALGVYGAMGGLGSTLGLILGGVLTEYLDWRWVFFINLPIAVLVLLGTKALNPGERDRGKADIPGAITVAAGVTAAVYAITNASSDGWGSSTTIWFLVAAGILLFAFLVIQMTSDHAMIPSRVVRDRGRVSANLAFLLVGAGMFGTYYFLTLYMQNVKHYSAVETGIAYLPLAFGMAISAGAIGPKLLARFSPRTVTMVGLVVAVCGMLWFSTLSAGSAYWTVLLPAMILNGLGLGMAFVSMTISGVGGVEPQDSGVASGLINTSQQIGGALGLAALNAIALAVTTSKGAGSSGSALTSGYATAFLVAGGIYLVAVLLTGVLSPQQSAPVAPETAQAGVAG